MNKVVYFSSFFYNRISYGTSIYAGICSYFDFFFYYNFSYLLDFHIIPFYFYKTESVRSYDCSRLYYGTVSDFCKFSYCYIGVNDTVIPYFSSFKYGNIRIDYSIFTYFHIMTDVSIYRRYICTFTNLCRIFS